MKRLNVFTLILVATSVRTALTFYALTVTWDYTVLRKAFEASISAAVTQAPSEISCTYFCSRNGGPGPFSMYYDPETEVCQCNNAVDGSPEDPDVGVMVYGVILEGVQEEIVDGVSQTTVFPSHQDCLQLYDAMYRTDGVYLIQPVGGTITDTWCDMTNGGWTVILRRSDGSENFNRSWSDYESGFGNRTGEYWLGLENVHQLTQTGRQLMVEMEAFPGVTPLSGYTTYVYFMVGDSVSKYKLNVNSPSGSCGNSLDTANGRPFSTFDSDNDRSDQLNCALCHRGGWWHNECHRSMLTGIYYFPGDAPDLGIFGSENFSTGIHWVTCWDRSKSLKSATMKII